MRRNGLRREESGEEQITRCRSRLCRSERWSEVGRGGSTGREGLEEEGQTRGREKEVRGHLEGWEK